MEKMFEFWKKMPPVWRFVVGLALLAAACFGVSCSRSSMQFKGTGDVEFVYKGSSGPSLSKESD